MFGIRVSFVSAFLLGLAACSGGFGTMDGIMKSWQGQHIDAVISQWGYPHEERNIAGRKLYIWHHAKGYNLPSQTYVTGTVVGSTVYGTATTYGGGTFRGNCTRTLEVSPSDVVTAWQWEGNNCPFAELLEYSNWRRKGDGDADVSKPQETDN